jgi:hypothetical protein
MYGLALENQTSASGAQSTEVTPILINLAAAHMSLGDRDAASPLFDQAYAIRREALGDEHAQTKAALKWVTKCLAASEPG